MALLNTLPLALREQEASQLEAQRKKNARLASIESARLERTIARAQAKEARMKEKRAERKAQLATQKAAKILLEQKEREKELEKRSKGKGRGCVVDVGETR